jgi:hypothetical protein
MNGFKRKPARSGARRLLWAGPIMIAISSIGLGQAEAAPIHKVYEFAGIDPDAFRTWPEYVLGGATVWSSVPHPQLTAENERAIWRAIKADPTESNPFVQFFQFRQDLAPQRFDHYHPRLALELHNIVAAAEAQQATSTPPTANPSVQAQVLGPGAEVPEPSSLLIVVGMVGYAVWRRHRA